MRTWTTHSCSSRLQKTAHNRLPHLSTQQSVSLQCSPKMTEVATQTEKHTSDAAVHWPADAHKHVTTDHVYSANCENEPKNSYRRTVWISLWIFSSQVMTFSARTVSHGTCLNHNLTSVHQRLHRAPRHHQGTMWSSGLHLFPEAVFFPVRVPFNFKQDLVAHHQSMTSTSRLKGSMSLQSGFNIWCKANALIYQQIYEVGKKYIFKCTEFCLERLCLDIAIM